MRCMREHLAVATLSTAITGCSLLYNPSNLPGGRDDAGVDAPPDVEIVLDADPTMLELVAIDPPAIDEGQGDGGSRPALIVIGGHHIIDNNTTVDITADSGAQLTLGEPVIAKNGNWIAISVTAHVDPSLSRGRTRTLTVEVTQTLPAGGTKTVSLSGKLALIGYEELDPDKLPLIAGKIDSKELDPVYSTVDLSALSLAKFGGGDRAKLRSVSAIKVAALDATGADGAGNAVAGEAGGCGGGAPASPGTCPIIGGGAGTSADLLGGGGGGGGGFAGDGAPGNGRSAGGAGASTGDERISTYDGHGGLSQNRPGGGGGGGPLLGVLGIITPGGGGGASGGSIELTAGGDISVGSITANGGTGQSALLTAGGGGGGAGGLVMLRAGGVLKVNGTISVTGGKGGGTSGNSGGKGADGRVRWDAPSSDPPTVAPGVRTVHRGLSLVSTTQVFRVTDPAISVIGAPNTPFTISVENEGTLYAGGRGGTDSSGNATINPPLHQGLNHVCVVLENGNPAASEARTCVDVAFLP